MRNTNSTTMKTLAALVLAGLTTGCTLDEMGGAETVCDQAVDHLAACGVTNLPDTGSCDATKQRLAAQVLEVSCADVDQRTSFSGSSCDSIWSIFNPSCWGSFWGTDKPTKKPLKVVYAPEEEEEPEPHDESNCNCETGCAALNECCRNCGKGACIYESIYYPVGTRFGDLTCQPEGLWR